jgi:hypothetical protein
VHIAEASIQCIICMDFVNSIAIFRRLSPLHYFLCALGNFMRRRRGEKKRFDITTLLSARGIKSKMHAHIYIHTRKQSSYSDEIERVTLLMTFIIMPSVCVGEESFAAARMQHNKKTSPANSDDTKCYFL